jgi:predicted nucleic acid-binding protein
VSQGAYQLVPFTLEDLAVALDTLRAYPDLAIGIADASIVALSHRFRCNAVLTLDQRHFRILRTRDGGSFRILPSDR